MFEFPRARDAGDAGQPSLTLEDPRADEDSDDDSSAGDSSAAEDGFVWKSSLRETFSLMPRPEVGDKLRVLLDADGCSDEEILARLPVDLARRRTRAGDASEDQSGANARRLRDLRQVAQSVGLGYVDDGGNRVTDLGLALRRSIPTLHEKTWRVLGQYAAYALAAAQLKNPLSVAGRSYPDEIQVFPFAYIWRAMLALDGQISSDELNRAIFRTHDLDSLHAAIEKIAWRRKTDADHDELGAETVSGRRKNDRIIPWVSLASFGWMFIRPKDSSEYYRLRSGAAQLLAGPAHAKRFHHKFDDPSDYVRHLSNCACLPKDLR